MADDELQTRVFGLPLKITGINTIGMLIMACAVAGCMWLLYTASSSNEIQLTAIQATLAMRANEHREMMSALNVMNEGKLAMSAAINEQNYIILSDGAERERIKKGLSMPQSLKDKINR